MGTAWALRVPVSPGLACPWEPVPCPWLRVWGVSGYSVGLCDAVKLSRLPFLPVSLRPLWVPGSKSFWKKACVFTGRTNRPPQSVSVLSDRATFLFVHHGDRALRGHWCVSSQFPVFPTVTCPVQVDIVGWPLSQGHIANGAIRQLHKIRGRNGTLATLKIVLWLFPTIR